MQLTFATFDAYPLLDPTIRDGIGGAEVRAMTFARGLRDNHSAQITVLVKDRPGLKTPTEGLHVLGYRKPRRSAVAKLGYSIAKRLSRRPEGNSFFRALQTDVVLCFGVRNDTASIVRSSKESGKKCVVFLTSDRNIDDAMRQGGQDRGVYGEIGYLCRFVLAQADLVIAQSPYQRDMLYKQLGITGRLVRNPIDLNKCARPQASREWPTMLWVGRADTFSKRADLCIELAKRCPQYRFKMVMNNHDQSTFAHLESTAPTNVEVVEQVPFSNIETLFAEASLLINTSAAEGFPNSFLQAAKYGKPIVSLDVDPGNMLSGYGCGICAGGDLEYMSEVVDRFVLHQDFYDEAAKRAVQYVVEYHDATARCAELYEALVPLLPPARKFVA